MVLNLKKKDKIANLPISVKVGDVQVVQEEQAKLLGIIFNEKQNWNSQIQGSGDVVSSLNQGVFIIKKIKNHIGPKSLIKLVDGLR